MAIELSYSLQIVATCAGCDISQEAKSEGTPLSQGHVVSRETVLKSAVEPLISEGWALNLRTRHAVCPDCVKLRNP